MTDRRGTAAPIPPAVAREMRGRSWREDPRCPPLDTLRLLRVPFVDFRGAPRQGELVVAAEVADELLAIFAQLLAQRFPIERMERIDAFGGDDDASMAANNTCAFNFRTIAGSETLSHHALGLAVDINPRLNPMVIGDAVHPPSGRPYLRRDRDEPGLITRPGPVVALFERYGWHWGGDWPDLRDYHHFSKLPRGAIPAASPGPG